jgi:hypothetical protein
MHKQQITQLTKSARVITLFQEKHLEKIDAYFQTRNSPTNSRSGSM